MIEYHRKAVVVAPMRQRFNAANHKHKVSTAVLVHLTEWVQTFAAR